MLVFFPCAWYHKTNFNSQSQTADEATREAATNNVDEITIEKVNGYGNERKSQSNEGAPIKGTCETGAENVIIVHEENRSKSTAAVDCVINNKLEVENEANLAIQMLDIVLEAEDEGDSISSRRVSGQSITAKDADVPVITLSDEVNTEKSHRNRLPPLAIDCEIDWKEIENEIDEILERALTSVAEFEAKKSTEIQSVDDENVFKNQKFLTHLNDLISKSNQQTSPSVNVQSKTLDRSSDARQSTNLKHSKSAPDFNLILKLSEATNSSFKDDTSIHYNLSDEEDENDVGAATAPIPPPPVFSAELFEKVATLKRKDKKEEETVIEREKPRVEVVAATEDESVSHEGDSTDKENFRDKLEKLLRAPPTRLSLIAPVPLPRTSLARNDNHEQHALPSEQYTPAPVSATMLRQRELFDEVLRKLQPGENL